jgi:hypothetical protein
MTGTRLVGCLSGLLSFFCWTEVIKPQSPSSIDATPVGITRTTKVVVGEGYVTATESFEARITVLEIARGRKAWDLVTAASTSNKPPASGLEYIVARIRFEFGEKGVPGDQRTYGVRDEQFALASETGRLYENPSVLPPKPALSGRVYPGDALEGWIAFLVAIDDNKPLMSFGNNYSRVWFQLYQ